MYLHDNGVVVVYCNDNHNHTDNDNENRSSNNESIIQWINEFTLYDSQ